LFYFPIFFFKPHCLYISHLNLRPLIFGLTPFHTVGSITLAPTHSIISYRDSFDLNLFDLNLFSLYLLFLATKLGRVYRVTVSTIPWKRINEWRYTPLDS